MLGALKQWLFPARPLPRLEMEVPWREYWNKLELADKRNVRGIQQRLQSLSNKKHCTLIMMAIGSVLNSKEPNREYNDVDLLLLCLDEECENFAQELLFSFAAGQKETIKRKRKPIRRAWNLTNAYECNYFWDLRFPKGKTLQLFVPVYSWNMALEKRLWIEGYLDFLKRRFAYTIINPQ